MAMAEAALASTSTYGSTRGGTLADVVELILDKGLVIDAFIRVSLIGIEVLTIDARIVIASVDTYLRFAEAVNRLDLTQTKQATTFEDIMEGSGKKKTKEALGSGKEKAKEAFEGAREGASSAKEKTKEAFDGAREGVMARMARRGRHS